jgi:glucose/arabinose dehydrogenase
MKKLLPVSLMIFVSLFLRSQTSPTSLRQDVKVQYIMKVKEKCARVAKDPVSGNLWYITSVGKVYQVKNLNSKPYDTLMYTQDQHGIAYLQGMTFLDSTLFLIGNKMIDSTTTEGMIRKAVFQPNGTRNWVEVMTTQPYPQSYTWYDHGFSGIVISPDKQHIYFSSGSRTDHGEIQSNKGLYPGLREVPLTSALFRIPANSVNLTLPNTDAGIAPYLYADGLRNTFDMAFDANGELFGLENSGDRDDPDEMNWIRQGKHYGFPWVLGGNDNPQQFTGYDKDKDPLLNVQSHCYLQGYYGNDPTFPSKGSLVFEPAIINTGPHADNFRESNGKVNDGSASGKFITTFTSHRSPLGLAFDRNKELASDLTGDAFVASYTRKGDSTGLDEFGYPGTIVDAGQDLLHINLLPDGSGAYKLSATTIVKDFYYPVDTYMDGNILYVIEYNDNGAGRLYKVTLPAGVTGITKALSENDGRIFPNPTGGKFTIELDRPGGSANVCIYDVLGNCVLRQGPSNSPSDCSSAFCIDLQGEAKGVYMVQITNGDQKIVKKLVID